MEKDLFVEINGLMYDFNPYYGKENIAGYFGFIGPDGAFYKVRRLTDIPSDRPHNSWAREYIKFNNMSSNDDIGTSSTALVNKYGFILYTCYNEWEQCGQELFILPGHDGIYKSDACETKCENINQLKTIKDIVLNNLEYEQNYYKTK